VFSLCWSPGQRLEIGVSTHCESNTKNFTFQGIVYRGRSSFKDEQLQYVLVIFYSLPFLDFAKIKVHVQPEEGD
jgi:hypothetical protein